MTTVVRLKRKDGIEVVGCDVYIGRAMYQGGWRLPASKWANPFTLKQCDRATALEKYRDHVRSRPDLMAALPELRGKRLGCWCVEARCHTCGGQRGECEHLQCHGEVLVQLLEAADPTCPWARSSSGDSVLMDRVADRVPPSPGAELTDEEARSLLGL